MFFESSVLGLLFPECLKSFTCILSEDYSVTTISPKRLTKILLSIPMDPVLNFLERADREQSFQKHILLPPLVYSFELWLFVLGHVPTSQNCLYPPEVDGGL